jgi:hypothetical protein
MTRVEKLEQEVKELARSELAAFRKWFQEYETTQWDIQIEEDVATGKLNRLAQKALAEHRAESMVDPIV